MPYITLPTSDGFATLDSSINVAQGPKKGIHKVTLNHGHFANLYMNTYTHRRLVCSVGYQAVMQEVEGSRAGRTNTQGLKH